MSESERRGLSRRDAIAGLAAAGAKQQTLRLTKHGSGFIGRLALGVRA
jgi:hypothetical protein